MHGYCACTHPSLVPMHQYMGELRPVRMHVHLDEYRKYSWQMTVKTKICHSTTYVLEFISQIKSFISQLGTSPELFSQLPRCQLFQGPSPAFRGAPLPSYLFSDEPRRTTAQKANTISTKNPFFSKTFGFKRFQQNFRPNYFSTRESDLKFKIKCFQNQY